MLLPRSLQYGQFFLIMRVLPAGLLLVLSILLAPARLSAQVDVIRGKVTSTDGAPLANVRITATSIPGNVTKTTRTDSRGSFQLAFQGGQGDYMMGYALVGYAFRQFEIKRTVDQDVLVADTRLQAMQLDTVVTTAPVQQRVSRNSTTADVSGTERGVSNAAVAPELQGNLAAMAASLPGVTLIPGVDGAPDGFGVLGLGADANTTTLNGLNFNGGNLPRDAAVNSSLTTSPYDPSRGGFSGANMNLRSGSGSNFRNRGINVMINSPQTQWTDRAAKALGTEYTSLSLGGLMSGPIQPNKAFYNVSWQLDHNSRVNQTLLNTGPLGLQTAGVAQDSVARLLGMLDDRGIPSAGYEHGSRLNDNASVFGSIDIQPPNSVNGVSYSIAFNGNFGRQSPVGGGVTQLGSASGDRTNFGGGVQLRTNRYFGLILSESSVGVNSSHNSGEAYLNLPSGRVRVNSLLADGASGVQSLGFGGNQGLFSESQSLAGTFQNTLSWFDNANKHRIKLTTELQYSSSQQNFANNLLGTFTYNSLADFEAGRPAAFTRQLTTRQRDLNLFTAALSLGDSWRKTPNLQIQYGVRVENTHYGQHPLYNGDVDQTFGRRNDRVPTPIAVSPRLGFSWTLGTSNDIAAFSGAFRPPRSVVRGGIGVFTNSAQSGSFGSAIDNTGLPSGVQQIVCTGDAVPLPDWNAFASNSAAIPDRCADGTTGTVFANSAPNVVLFSRSFAPQRSVRSNLSWQGAILDARFTLNVEGTWARNLNQQQSVDINFQPTRQFALAAEGDRPVFVLPTSIDTLTGAIASRDARVSPKYNRVSELRSDITSQTSQVSFRLSPINRTPRRLAWSAAYTYLRVREQVPGFQSTAGSPLGTEWTTAATGPHQVNYTLRYNFFNYVSVNWVGQFRSGNAFTPVVAGDINGDGAGNDRAFIPDPLTTTDAALRDGLQQLLATVPSSTRRCLESQMGRVADRNSCRAPWSSGASLTIALDRARFHMPQRAQVSFSLTNPLGAADLAVNGSGSLRGWGQSPSPDQSLLYVRGFNPLTGTYKYEVNQRFGQTRPQFVTLRAPVTMTLAMRIDLGPTRERQTLVQQMNAGRLTPGTRMTESSFRSWGASSVGINPMTQIIRQQDSLRLTALQADSIASMNRRYAYRTDSLWTPIARQLASMPEKYQKDEATERYVRARRAQMDLLITTVKAVSELLTAEQKRKLPQQLTQYLDPRFLELIRDGNGLYVTSQGSP